MNQRLRQERSVFLLFLGAMFVSLISALPILTATLPAARHASVEQRTVATFEQLDRNHDGYVDRGEALALPGLDRVFNEADRRPDGRLDKVEYAKALALIDALK
jgi:Ca2+-binding EF-hand superfamily protein